MLFMRPNNVWFQLVIAIKDLDCLRNVSTRTIAYSLSSLYNAQIPLYSLVRKVSKQKDLIPQGNKADRKDQKMTKLDIRIPF